MGSYEFRSGGMFVRALSAAAAVGFTTAICAAGTTPCVVADDGSGTVVMPPPDCGYVSPDEFHMIVDGLPAGTTIIVKPTHHRFVCKNGLPIGNCNTPGGPLGGEVEDFQSSVIFDMTGTGDLDGFQRVIEIPILCQAATGPRNPGDPVQTFPNEMVQLQGAIFGDPDFDQLEVVGGSGFGLPSPGETTLTDLGNGNWTVDSFFDIAYTITFVGAPGGALDGLSGSTTDTVRMEATGPPAVVPTVSQWGLIVMSLLLLTGGTLVIRRQRTMPVPA